MAKNIETFGTTTTTNAPGFGRGELGAYMPIYDTSMQQFASAQGAFPSLAQYPGMTPLLNIANLTPEQQALIQQIQGQGAASPQLQAAGQQLQQLTSGPIGSSPLTQEAMKAYEQQVVPSLIQQESAAGRGSGGAALESVAQGTQQAMIPLLQQEIQNREAAVNQYQQLQQSQIQSLAAALEAAGMPRDVALQQAAAQYQQQQQALQFQEMISTLPLNLLPQLLGKQVTGRMESHTTKNAGDWIGGALQILGNMASVQNSGQG